MIKDILERTGDKIVNKIIENLEANGISKTGKTARSLKSNVKEENDKINLSVTARKFFQAVETGTKPSSKKPSPEYIENLEEWKSISGAKGSPWAIATKNLKEGSTLYRSGGRKDIYSNVLEQVLPGLRKEIAKELKDGIIGR